MRRLAAGASLAFAAGVLLAQPGAAKRTAPQAANHCAAGETVLYSCRFGRSLGSVCGAPGRVAYRFGPAGKPAIDIASAPDWSNVRFSRVVGGGGGRQNHMRFTANGHDYVVHEAIAGNLTAIPGKQWSGIVVYQGDRELANLECRGKPVLPGPLDDAAALAPEAVRRALEDTDPHFDAWF